MGDRYQGDITWSLICSLHRDFFKLTAVRPHGVTHDETKEAGYAVVFPTTEHGEDWQYRLAPARLAHVGVHEGEPHLLPVSFRRRAKSYSTRK